MRSEGDKKQSLEKLRQESKDFGPLRVLFDRMHYEILKSKTPSLKEAEALFHRQATKDKEIDSMMAEINEVLQSVNSISFHKN